MSTNYRLDVIAIATAALIASQDGLAIPSENILTNRSAVVRSIDGSQNNTRNPDWGSVGVPLRRLVDPDYQDGVASPSGEDRPSPRIISNEVAAVSESRPSTGAASDFVWQWGQFLDHDIDLTEPAHTGESFNIQVPAGDPFFDPIGTGSATISLSRSQYHVVDGVRQQVNQITAYIDASNVYGSDTRRARGLRTLDGSGKLKTSSGNLLPFNTSGLPNAGGTSANLFVAGDVRANEQIGLTTMHALFVREHNFLAGQIKAEHPSLSGDDIYEFVRAIVAAEMQAITYNEFLPKLLGRNSLRRYRGYDPSVDPSIMNEFSAGAYRFGHSMLSDTLKRVKADGTTIARGNIPLQNAFFSPGEVISEGLEPILRGLVTQRAQQVDNQVVDGVRNFLFGPPGAGGFDLASLNIQRGRDHGLADFNSVRQAIGLQPVTRFHHVTGDFGLADKLEEIYGDINNMDLWVAGLAELHHPRGILGRTFHKILVEQFSRLRMGDRYWYENSLPASWVRWVNQQKLSKIIKRNTAIGSELPDDVFTAQQLNQVRRNGNGNGNGHGNGNGNGNGNGHGNRRR